MKKIAFVLALSLLLQSIPAKTIASCGAPPPPPPSVSGTSIAVVIGLGLLALGIFDGTSSSAKATGTEFEKLNNNPAFPVLLKQMAGGSLNTVEILN